MLAEIERKIAGILRAIEDGAYNPTLTARLTALEAEKTAAETWLAATATPSPIRLHPDLPALYRNKVERLAEALNEPATASEAGDILRSLVERVVLTPASEGLRAELYGDLAAITAMTEGAAPKNKNPGSVMEPGLLSVVAGEGFEPSTFRL